MVLISRGTDGAATPSPAPAATEIGSPTTLVLSDTLETVEAPPLPDATPVAPEPIEASELADEPTASSAPIVTTVVSLMATGAIVAVWLVSGTTPDVEPGTPTGELSVVVQSEPIETPEPIVEDAILEPEPSRPPQDPTSVDLPISALPPEPVVDNESDETAPTPPLDEPRLALASPPPPPTSSEPAGPEPGPEPELDPLLFDPAEAVVILRKSPAPQETIETPAAIDNPTIEAPSKADGPPSLDERLANAARQAGVFVRRGPTDAESTPPGGSAEKDLTQVIPSIDLQGVPLERAIDLLGRIAGRPITLAPDALRRAGVAADTPIELQAEGESVGRLLNRALKPFRLVLTTDGPHAGIARRGAEKERTVTHQLGDLAADDPGALAELLGMLLPTRDAPPISDRGEWPLTAPMATHYDLLVLAERLRVARGLPTTTKYPREALSIDSPWLALGPKLDRRATFSFVEPTPLGEVVNYWQRALGVTILVDWRSLADAGLGPRSTVECSITNRAWRDGLDGVLGPLGLGWTALDGPTLWLSTEAALADRTTIEFLAAPRDEAEALRAGLRDRHPTAAAVYDPLSGRLLVRGDATTQRDAAGNASQK